MSRIRLELPATLPFATELPVRITDINYGGHLANDALLGILHEARIRFLKHCGLTEADVGGCGMLMVDVAIQYRKEVYHGEALRIEVGVTELRRAGCDFAYRVTEVSSGALVVEAQTGMTFFNYQTKKMVRAPEKFALAVRA